MAAENMNLVTQASNLKWRALYLVKIRSNLFSIKKVVDMRWGVRDEMTNEHMTTDLCMTELRNCQRLSMGPNFIYFGAQKYGYRPIPTYVISSGEMCL